MKYTKIVCTIGPASEKAEMLNKMVASGMDVARLNFSHGTYENHKMLMENVRAVSKKQGRPVAIMQDLQGPKIRIGDLKAPATVKAGEVVVLGRGGLPVQFDLSKIVKTGQRVLIDDGLIELKVQKVLTKAIQCSVVLGGTIISHKGINVPESKTNFSVFTAKDKKDLVFGLRNSVDYVAMSFVRSAKDILEVKTFINKRLKKGKSAPWVVAKIEKTQAIRDLNKIIRAADAIMVARGDLGIEAAPEMVPVYQKQIIRACLAANKPVIVATQMLDSMMRNPRPTRAETSDVSNAVFDHADCVMLSGESAFGKYPLEAVSTMNKIIKAAEVSYFDNFALRKNSNVNETIRQAIKVAKKHRSPIVLFADSPSLALMLSNLRQEIPLFAYSSDSSVARKLALVWGINPYALEAKIDGSKLDLVWETVSSDLTKRFKFKRQTDVLFMVLAPLSRKGIYISAQLKKIA
jgi:pyruvate kinase